MARPNMYRSGSFKSLPCDLDLPVGLGRDLGVHEGAGVVGGVHTTQHQLGVSGTACAATTL